MKNKESKTAKQNDEDIKKKLKQGAMSSTPASKKKSGPSKSQINRLKKLYNTTRWLSNSAFTTYFGKPAFENYGYGNTNPVYGGLFYGNYMLSHNMNPIDGTNHPSEKQVYSSAMMKSLQREPIRKPSPPRMVPDEIRNTTEELKEINSRCQIFQLPNNLPARDIIPPNLLKARYFRSGQNSPNDSVNLDDEEDKYEVWNVENVLEGKKNKTKKIERDAQGKKYNPYEDGKVKLQKKKMKEEIDNKINEDLYQKVKDKKERKKENEKKKNALTQEKQLNTEEQENQYQKEKAFYINMLGEDCLNNLENIGELKIKERKLEESKEAEKIEKEQKEKKKEELIELKDNTLQSCKFCESCKASNMSTLRKKENPALMAPNEIKNDMICCMHHSQELFTIKEKDPRNYTNMPPCMMSSVIPAGKPLKRNAPLQLFG